MIWFIEIPVIVFVILGMLAGSAQIGCLLHTIGITVLIIGFLVWIISLYSDRDTKVVLGGVLMINGAILLLTGMWFGEHTLFEFLFGTGWF